MLLERSIVADAAVRCRECGSRVRAAARPLGQVWRPWRCAAARRDAFPRGTRAATHGRLAWAWSRGRGKKRFLLAGPAEPLHARRASHHEKDWSRLDRVSAPDTGLPAPRVAESTVSRVGCAFPTQSLTPYDASGMGVGEGHSSHISGHSSHISAKARRAHSPAPSSCHSAPRA